MYGRSASGTSTEPSGRRWVSTSAAQTRGTASAEPLSVCTKLGADRRTRAGNARWPGGPGSRVNHDTDDTSSHMSQPGA